MHARTILWGATVGAAVAFGACTHAAGSDTAALAETDESALREAAIAGGNGSSLTVSVVGGAPGGAQGILTCLWERSQTGEVEERGPLDDRFASYYWRGTDGSNWRLRGGRQGREAVFDDLPPGDYRLSAQVDQYPDRDPTPVGVGPVVRMAGAGAHERAEIRLVSGVPLTIKVTDAATDEPMEHASGWLARPDGLRIRFGPTAEDGAFHYSSLAPGTYGLHVRQRAWRYGDVEYGPREDPVQIEVAVGQANAAAVPLVPLELPPGEIEKRWPFCVAGKVADAAGRPMEGVEVTVGAGIGTLLLAGSARTGPDGGYALRFAPGMLTRDEQTGKWWASLQTAVVRARKDGCYERDLCRQGHLGVAERLRPDDDTSGYAAVVRPDAPGRVDFVLLPAAVVDGRLVDKGGRPLPDKRLHVSGNELPPAQNVLASLVTDRDGWFRADLPCKSYRFVLPGKHRKDDMSSQTFEFAVPGSYCLLLTYHKPFLGEASFEGRLTSTPATGPGGDAEGPQR